MSAWMHVRDGTSCKKDVHRTLQFRNFGRKRSEEAKVSGEPWYRSERRRQFSAAYLAPMPASERGWYCISALASFLRQCAPSRPSKLDLRPSPRGDERPLTGEDDGGRASLRSRKGTNVRQSHRVSLAPAVPWTLISGWAMLALVPRRDGGDPGAGQAGYTGRGRGDPGRTIAEKKGLGEA